MHCHHQSLSCKNTGWKPTQRIASVENYEFSLVQEDKTCKNRQKILLRLAIYVQLFLGPVSIVPGPVSNRSSSRRRTGPVRHWTWIRRSRSGAMIIAPGPGPDDQPRSRLVQVQISPGPDSWSHPRKILLQLAIYVHLRGGTWPVYCHLSVESTLLIIFVVLLVLKVKNIDNCYV